MKWFGLTLLCILCWSTTDLFYKKGSELTDKLSHLKIMVSCYTVLLLQMGISGDLLAAACALSALFDMVEAPCNTLCTELQLLLTARKHNLMTGGKAAQQHTPEVTR